jgi:hypothetical protein
MGDGAAIAWLLVAMSATTKTKKIVANAKIFFIGIPFVFEYITGHFRRIWGQVQVLMNPCFHQFF